MEMNSSLFILFILSVLYKELAAQTGRPSMKGIPANKPNIQWLHLHCPSNSDQCEPVHYSNLVSAILNGLRLKNKENPINTDSSALKTKNIFSNFRNQSTLQTRLLQDPYIVPPRQKNHIRFRNSNPTDATLLSKRPLGWNKPEPNMPPRMPHRGYPAYPGHPQSRPDRVHRPPENPMTISQNRSLENPINILRDRPPENRINAPNSLPETPVNESQNLHFENMEAKEINKTVYAYDTGNDIYNKFLLNLDKMERKYYQVSFQKLVANAPPGREVNGISFAQSGVLLYLTLMAISSEVDADTKLEIDDCLGLVFTSDEKRMIIEKTLSSLPSTGGGLKIRWGFRLMLSPNISVAEQFKIRFSQIKNFHVDHFNGSETPEMLTKIVNDLVATDSGGAMHNTFDEDELSDGVLAVLTSILYVRGQWRAAPTLLNGTTIFRDIETAPDRTFCSIRINDVMRYAEFHEWDAEGVEISYATPGLTLLLLVPRGSSLARLVEVVSSVSILEISSRLQSLRAAVTLPLYTLRMTLLLPNKLEAMGLPGLVDKNSTTSSLKLSHAVQRLMFWSEAGRNAYKDDGIEWDVPPELEILIDRPYIYFVRWNNMTLLNGNFVL